MYVEVMSEMGVGWHTGDDGQSRWWDGTQWGVAPAGWYRLNNGRKRWWDGEQWGPLAPLEDDTTNNAQIALPAQAVQQPTFEPIKKKSGIGCCGWIIIVPVLIGIISAIVAGINGSNSASPSSNSSTSTSTPTPPPPPQKTDAEVRDESMIAQGFSVWDSGETYVRSWTDEERANSSCGYAPCIDYILYSHSGCASGFYVKADLISNDTPVGWTNEISASVQPQESVVVRLEDFQRIAEKWRIAEVNCMG